MECKYILTFETSTGAKHPLTVSSATNSANPAPVRAAMDGIISGGAVRTGGSSPGSLTGRVRAQLVRTTKQPFAV